MTGRNPTGGTRTVRVFGIEADRFTGAGMIHRALADRLETDLGGDWRVESENGSTSILSRLVVSPRPSSASVWLSSPMPARRPAGAFLPFVYDLRWRGTRSGIARRYRSTDLRRLMRHADHIFTISDHVRSQLIEVSPRRADDVSVVPMGPGQFEGRPVVSPIDSRTILMIGRARHKRNEELARLLVTSSLVREDFRVRAVSVSDETKNTLQLLGNAAFFADQLDISELAQEYERASVYVTLGVSEGFGLPYVEAAHRGCDVIAADVPVAHEALGKFAKFVDAAEPTVEQLEQALTSWNSDRVRALMGNALSRSWDDTSQHVARQVKLSANANTRR